MESPEKKQAQAPVKKKWTEIAEIRMLLYVIPVGTALALIGLFLSQLSGR